jgi:asparagine synthase (glutamine-hydrolysing)
VLGRLGLGFLLEELAVPGAAVDPLRAVEVIEDYRPLDVECAAVLLALLEAIRERYPEWGHLADGDGGDENLKDYPIEEDPELTIRSVVNNRMLYQEGWGVGALKHSLVYSGGHSRGCVRGWAPARRFGFLPFSPFTRPSVVAVAEAIPFAALTAGSHERLYALKGEVLARGLRRHLGVELPLTPKRRFQHGAGGASLGARFAHPQERYRAHYASVSTAIAVRV